MIILSLNIRGLGKPLMKFALGRLLDLDTPNIIVY
jgi:hypothetical protein